MVSVAFAIALIVDNAAWHFLTILVGTRAAAEAWGKLTNWVDHSDNKNRKTNACSSLDSALKACLESAPSAW